VTLNRRSKVFGFLPAASISRIQTPLTRRDLLTAELAKLIAVVDGRVEQSRYPFTVNLEDQHFEEHHEDPGEDASVVADDEDIVETHADVSEQRHYEDEHDRYDQFVVHVIQASQ